MHRGGGAGLSRLRSGEQSGAVHSKQRPRITQNTSGTAGRLKIHGCLGELYG